MKRLMLIISIIAAFGIGGGALASTASAATNCTMHITTITYNPGPGYNLTFQGYATNCTDTSYVRVYPGQSPYTLYSGWYDVNVGGYGGVNGSSPTDLFPMFNNNSQSPSFTFKDTCGYFGINHTLRPYYRYALGNSSTGQVGSVFQKWGTDTNVWC